MCVHFFHFNTEPPFDSVDSRMFPVLVTFLPIRAVVERLGRLPGLFSTRWTVSRSCEWCVELLEVGSHEDVRRMAGGRDSTVQNSVLVWNHADPWELLTL